VRRTASLATLCGFPGHQGLFLASDRMVTSKGCWFSAVSIARRVFASTAPDPVVFRVDANIPSGPGSVNVAVGKIPSGKYFVAQTSSYYCEVFDPGATITVIINATFKGTYGYVTLPSAATGTATVPVGGALSANYYATAGASLSASLSIDSNGTDGADCYVTVAGYYINGTPND
jgi:hypothetical protein